MSILTLSALKARFTTTDVPTARDYNDLIDTLIANFGVTIPTGPAGGDLESDYPDPVIKAKAVTYAKIQDITAARLLGRHSGGAGNMEEIVVGSGLSLSGGALAVTGGGGGSGGSGTVAGAVSTFSSDALTLPGADGDLALFQAPVSFGNTMPQVVRYVAVCISSFANYAVGDEVPLDLFRMKDDPSRPAFTVTSYVTGGQVTAKVKVEYGTAGAGTGIAVYDRNLTTYTGPGSDASLVEFGSIAAAQAAFEVRVHMTRFEPGTGFGSVALYEPADQAIPAEAGLATFNHGFNGLPSFEPLIALVNVVADAATGHGVGDFVPITEAYETGFANPAFGVTINTTSILVRREATTIQIPHKTTGVLTTLTAAGDWQIRVRAARGVALPSVCFPATTFQLSDPMCAWGYGNLLYVVNYGNNGLTYLSRIDLTTNQVSLVREYNPSVIRGNMSLFRLANGGSPVDCFFVCDSRGIRRIRADTEAEDVLISGDFHHYKVLDFSEAGTGGYAHPDLLIVTCTYGSANVGSQTATLKTWNGSAYTNTSRPAINWSTLAGIGGIQSTFQSYSQSTPPIIHLSYNPIKRRIYMIHTGTGLMNIFKLDTGERPFTWWDASPLGTVLDCEKIIVIGGGGDTWTDTDSEHISVDYDTVTGNEKSIVICRRGNNALTGSVCRVPWNE